MRGTSDRPPILILSIKGEEVLKVDLVANKFADLIVEKLQGIGISVNVLNSDGSAVQSKEDAQDVGNTLTTEERTRASCY